MNEFYIDEEFKNKFTEELKCKWKLRMEEQGITDIKRFWKLNYTKIFEDIDEVYERLKYEKS